jgi:hypothetical protein
MQNILVSVTDEKGAILWQRSHDDKGQAGGIINPQRLNKVTEALAESLDQAENQLRLMADKE